MKNADLAALDRLSVEGIEEDLGGDQEVADLVQELAMLQADEVDDVLYTDAPTEFVQ